MPFNCLLLCIFYCIFVSVMILLSGVEAHTICPDRYVSSFVRGCLYDRGVVQVTVLVVLDQSVSVVLALAAVLHHCNAGNIA